MKKPYTFDQMSVRKCVVCGKRLKRNLVEKKPEADKCYKCYRLHRLENQGREAVYATIN